MTRRISVKITLADGPPLSAFLAGMGKRVATSEQRLVFSAEIRDETTLDDLERALRAFALEPEPAA